ncbi:hypothetical protein PoB_002389400 [Plakobranchus ocellatus]|uniref:Uncharacterized protein n=1 Tax=Plakobranchus ocellatus TaxID=259542 RepID=A0AAV3ZU22_9GAST|nr:hypothetical protein PoB_002389400 [Plakobranchus ocellatus]
MTLELPWDSPKLEVTIHKQVTITTQIDVQNRPWQTKGLANSKNLKHPEPKVRNGETGKRLMSANIWHVDDDDVDKSGVNDDDHDDHNDDDEDDDNSECIKNLCKASIQHSDLRL